MKKLTIGITTYNNEPFISELLYTICENFKLTPELSKDVDVIIYDDCSSDMNVIQVLREYEENFTIVYGDKNAKTPAFGRNFIIDNADSEYVLFMDGDDNFVCNIANLVSEISTKEADILVSDVVKINNDGILAPSPFIYTSKLFDFATDVIDNLHHYVVHQTGIWSVYRLEFLRTNEIRYREDLRYEDNYFMSCIYMNYPVVERLETKYYGWRTNFKSFSNTKGIIERRIEVYEEILLLIEKDINNPYAPYLLYSVWNQTYTNIIRGYPELSRYEFKHLFKGLNKVSKRHANTIKYLKKGRIKDTDKYFRITKFRMFRNFKFIYLLQIVNKFKYIKPKIRKKISDLFALLPIDNNKIFMTSQYGQYSDNTKYLYLKMRKDPKYDGKKIVFAVKNKNLAKHKDFIDYNNKILYYYHHYTAKQVYFNTWYSPQTLKRKEQEFIQLWHGIPFKKIHTDIHSYENNNSLSKQKMRQKSINDWDKLWSVNEYNTKIFTRLFPHVNIIEKEYPKVQWLIENQENNALKSKIYKKYKLDEGKKYTLYAPTYRPYKVFIDISEVKKLVPKNHTLLIHVHPMMKYEFVNFEGLGFLTLDEVDDIQEINLIMDELITDYSSIAYDFTQQGKPVIDYQFDKKLYNKIHGLYSENNYTDELPLN